MAAAAFTAAWVYLYGLWPARAIGSEPAIAPVYLAALLFGAAQALQINAQFFGLKVPSQFVGMLPYILTMIALTGIVGRTIPPAADGRAYEK